jgi:hypothetical protein
MIPGGILVPFGDPVTKKKGNKMWVRCKLVRISGKWTIIKKILQISTDQINSTSHLQKTG